MSAVISGPSHTAGSTAETRVPGHRCKGVCTGGRGCLQRHTPAGACHGTVEQHGLRRLVAQHLRKVVNPVAGHPGNFWYVFVPIER